MGALPFWRVLGDRGCFGLDGGKSCRTAGKVCAGLGRGRTCRLRRGWWGCRPEGGSTFFRRERKYQRKHAARRLREKGFYCPFCRRGSQCRAQWSWIAITQGRSALVLAFFPPTKWAGLFPSAAYRRAAPAQLAGNILNPCRVGCFGVACIFLQGKRPAGNPIHAGLCCEP